jgi:myo-inositol-1(or 4)-monophosphatase
VSLSLDGNAIRGWVAEAGEIARRHFGQVEPEWKGVASPVTAADREIERLLIDRIHAAYPDHGIIGEEYGGEALDRDCLWALDPIDGTRAYVEGLPSWSISVALLYRRQPVFGVIYIPLYDDWTYTDGDDVIHNGAVITDRLKTQWAEDSYVFWRSDARSLYELRFTRVMSMSSSASHLAYTARGASVATIIHDSYLWDIAAGAAMLAKQGGEIRAQSGDLLDFSRIDLAQRITGFQVAAHPNITRRLIPLITARPEPVHHPAW